jgi:hypothetical protein
MQNAETRKSLCCPLNGKLCIEGRREDFHRDENDYPVQCRWLVHLFGKDPQSEKTLDQFDCAVAWLPVTTIEGSQMARFTTASVDKLANEVADVKGVFKTGLDHVAGAFQALAQKVEESKVIELPPNGGDANGKRLE